MTQVCTSRPVRLHDGGVVSSCDISVSKKDQFGRFHKAGYSQYFTNISAFSEKPITGPQLLCVRVMSSPVVLSWHQVART